MVQNKFPYLQDYAELCGAHEGVIDALRFYGAFNDLDVGESRLVQCCDAIRAPYGPTIEPVEEQTAIDLIFNYRQYIDIMSDGGVTDNEASVAHLAENEGRPLRTSRHNKMTQDKATNSVVPCSTVKAISIDGSTIAIYPQHDAGADFLAILQQYDGPLQQHTGFALFQQGLAVFLEQGGISPAELPSVYPHQTATHSAAMEAC